MAQNAAEKTPSGEGQGSYAPARPFLKWAGGKTQILPQILDRCPAKFGRYFEPFLGGGAVFFALQPRQAFLSDLNRELIYAYKAVKTDLEALIVELQRHIYERDYYYKLRALDREPSFKRWSPLKKAARLIYLNKSCYNGLYRVNAQGHFNTPFGKYTAPTIVDAPNLQACCAALRRATISCAPFSQVERRAKAGDFVYFDPPYVPLTATANFTAYSKQGFNAKAQLELSALCRRLDKKGVFFLLSNSGTAAVRKLYSGFRHEFVLASRCVNSVGSRRGAVRELLIRNY